MNWLKSYIEYTKDQESPELFHFWTGITVLASVLNRQVWLDRRAEGVTRYRLYPGQLQLCLVAGSGLARKSTAVSIGRELMSKAGVRILKGKTSAEKLLRTLATPPNSSGSGRTTTPPDAIATIVASELSVFLSKQTYSEAIIDILTDLYDAEDPFVYSTNTHGDLTLRNPCITVFAAATPTSIGESIPPKAHSAGYLSRVIHVYAEGGTKINPLVDPDDEDVDPVTLALNQQRKQALLAGLFDLRKMHGSFSFTPEAREWFRDWYQKYHTSSEGKAEGYPARRADHLLRVAMILRVASFGDLLLDEAALQAAHLALAKIEKDFHKAFSQIGQNQSTRGQEKILEAITKNGGKIAAGLLKRQVFRFFRDIVELQKTLLTLQEAGLITYRLEGVPPVEYWLILP